MKTMIRFIFLSFSMLLVGCASTSGPVTIESPPIITTSGPEQAHNDQDKKGQRAETVALAQPVIPNQQPSSIPLLNKLSEQADQAINDHNYQQAINVAERGLRINRKDPRFYLALAKAYKALRNKTQSHHFARQGLRYVGNDSLLLQELQWLAR
jgi:predicted Zn-dependent protease